MSEDITFRRLEQADLPRMHRWLNTPHVRAWYGEEPRSEERTLTQVEARYLPRITGDAPTRSFLILCNGAPIGYIQVYRITDYPDYARYLQVDEDAAGVDLFIGEEAAVHRGLGPVILRVFLREHVFGEMSVESCLLGPEPKNRIAIRAYAKAGFRYLKTVQLPDETQPEYLMRISRAEALA